MSSVVVESARCIECGLESVGVYLDELGGAVTPYPLALETDDLREWLWNGCSICHGQIQVEFASAGSQGTDAP